MATLATNLKEKEKQINAELKERDRQIQAGLKEKERHLQAWADRLLLQQQHQQQHQQGNLLPPPPSLPGTVQPHSEREKDTGREKEISHRRDSGVSMSTSDDLLLPVPVPDVQRQQTEGSRMTAAGFMIHHDAPIVSFSSASSSSSLRAPPMPPPRPNTSLAGAVSGATKSISSTSSSLSAPVALNQGRSALGTKGWQGVGGGEGNIHRIRTGAEGAQENAAPPMAFATAHHQKLSGQGVGNTAVITNVAINQVRRGTKEQPQLGEGGVESPWKKQRVGQHPQQQQQQQQLLQQQAVPRVAPMRL